MSICIIDTFKVIHVHNEKCALTVCTEHGIYMVGYLLTVAQSGKRILFRKRNHLLLSLNSLCHLLKL